MAALPEIMDALAEQIETVLSEVTDVAINVQPRLFNAAELPSIDMGITTITGLESGLAAFGQRYGGIPISIRVRVSVGDLYAGEDLLLRLMDDEDPLSIVAALDKDPTLGGLLDTMGYGDGFPWTGYEPFADPNGGGDFLGSRLPIIIVKAGSPDAPVPPEPLPPEPIEAAQFVYDGTKTGANPGRGRIAAKTWVGSDAWAVNKTDADGIPRVIPAVGATFITTLPNGDQGTLSVDATPNDQGLWFQFQGTHTTSGAAPALGTVVTITRGP